MRRLQALSNGTADLVAFVCLHTRNRVRPGMPMPACDCAPTHIPPGSLLYCTMLHACTAASRNAEHVIGAVAGWNDLAVARWHKVAVAKRPKCNMGRYVRLCVDERLKWACASDAEKLCHELYVFTKSTGNGTVSIFSDRWFEWIQRDIRRFHSGCPTGSTRFL